MAAFAVRALTAETWDPFARLLEKHRGVWNGCWCLGFHAEGGDKGLDADGRRDAKRRLVEAGRAHAALVFDGDVAVGWCQFGPPAELPRIKHRRAYEQDLVALPDWRITCFFVDRERRGEGVAAAGLAGAVELIADLGGGVVESCPEDTAGRKVSGSFLFNAGLALFEANGFVRDRQVGKHAWIVRRTVASAG